MENIKNIKTIDFKTINKALKDGTKTAKILTNIPFLIGEKAKNGRNVKMYSIDNVIDEIANFHKLKNDKKNKKDFEKDLNKLLNVLK